ncbi:hypothetical protein K3495_g2884 [Podosphaera aphanis]|nr:hypothetical protein K3495_g2884 [Podosphaera aphanis]
MSHSMRNTPSVIIRVIASGCIHKNDLKKKKKNQSSLPPPTTKSKRLNRDQRIQIKTLRESGMIHTQIAAQLGLTVRQVGYTLSLPYLEPKKAPGRALTLSSQDVDQVEIFITSSSQGRRMSWLELAAGPFRYSGVPCDQPGPSRDRVRESVLHNELKKRGYAHHPALKKPPLFEVNKRKRLEWAEVHKDLSDEDWTNVLWTDETWVTAGQHNRYWITRKIGEELNVDCVVDKLRKMKSLGWMFLGSFTGKEEAPCLFGEKEWRSITSDSYCQRIVPLIDDMVSMRPWISVMQDNAPSHVASKTIEAFQERIITTIEWPPYSPDLNPIEYEWDSMKDYIQYHYPRLDGGRQRNHDELRGMVKSAWYDATEPHQLEMLDRSMGRRCEAVIKA